MKSNKKIAVLAAAAVILCGCSEAQPDATVSTTDNVSETVETTTVAVTTTRADTTTKAETEKTTAAVTTTLAETTKKPSETTLAVTTTAKAVTTAVTTAVSAESGYARIADLPVGKLFEINFGKGYGSIYNLKSAEGNYLYTEAREFESRGSSGMISKTLDSKFTTAVENAHNSVNYNDYWYDNKRYTVEEITDERIVTGEELMGYESYADFKVKYAFVRKTGKESYEFIIDPACMSDIPLWTNDPQFMKFNVNGTEFYADTIKVSSNLVNRSDDDVISNSPAPFSDIPDDKYVYAKVIFAYLENEFSTVNGYNCQADLYDIKTITEDTDAVIDRSFFKNYFAGDDTYNALTSAKEEIEALAVTGAHSPTVLSTLDLDFDGTDEILAAYCTGTEWYSDVNTKIYSVTDGALTELDDIAIGFIREGSYNGKHGWLTSYGIIDELAGAMLEYMENGYYFLTLENGEIKKEALCCAKSNGESIDYYYLGKKIEPKVTSLDNPYNGREINLYEWKDYSVYGTTAEFLYDEICEKLMSEICFVNSEMITPAAANYDSGYALDCLPYEDAAVNIAINEDIKKAEDSVFEMIKYAYREIPAVKPVLYLYPETETNVSVEASFPYGGEFTCTYPQYNDGWSVTAMPDGTLFDENGDEYYCLYWEAMLGKPLDMSKGFCVSGSDTAEFLREKLMGIGLTARETNEFIIYWLPLMEDNPYNVITFQTDEYIKTTPLTISPAPDSSIRVFMTWYSSDEAVEILPQTLPEYERNGFTIVEWGGTEYYCNE